VQKETSCAKQAIATKGKGLEMGRPECSVQGMLQGGRAMCGSVMTGGKFCGAPRGECSFQIAEKTTRKKKIDYAAFDAQLITLIAGGMSGFTGLSVRLADEAKKFCEKPKDETFRVVDRRLQALRKAGRIGHDTEHGWRIRQADGGYASDN